MWRLGGTGNRVSKATAGTGHSQAPSSSGCSGRWRFARVGGGLRQRLPSPSHGPPQCPRDGGGWLRRDDLVRPRAQAPGAQRRRVPRRRRRRPSGPRRRVLRGGGGQHGPHGHLGRRGRPARGRAGPRGRGQACGQHDPPLLRHRPGEPCWVAERYAYGETRIFRKVGRYREPVEHRFAWRSSDAKTPTRCSRPPTTIGPSLGTSELCGRRAWR